jgi:hypothetical protein
MSTLLQQDYDELVKPGNIAFFESCEVTQLFLYDKISKKPINVFILACFEEKPFVETNHQFLTKRLKVSNNLSLCIQRYSLSLSQAAATFTHLLQANEWDFDGDTSLILSPLTGLTKQFIPSSESVRINAALKNNFGSGSYAIEFFDESKQHVQSLFALENIDALNQLSEQINTIVPLDLAVARERLGNILFQFPIRLMVSSSQALSGWNGVRVKFKWHPNLTTIPACFVQVESELDQVYLGNTIQSYNGQAQQEIITGNLDGLNTIKIWRSSPPLLLHLFRGTYLKGINFRPSIIQPVKRKFQSQGQTQQVTVQSSDQSSQTRPVTSTTYRQHITNVLYTAGREKLEQQLNFKQYFTGKRIEALTDLRTLLNQHGQHGAWLWDPFLSAEDILTTLFYCQHTGAPLLAIGSDNQATKKVYGYQGKPTVDVIADYASLLAQNANNSSGLRLEFRLQHENHGWAFHDRFLIFPATVDRPTPRAYSLGTSVNSVGNSHHVLQEVSHPQRIADAFQHLWNKLTHPDCLVWKI